MLKGEYLLLAQGVSTDMSNRVSVHAIFDQAHVPQVPAGFGGVTIAAKVRTDTPIVDKVLRARVSLKLKGNEVARAEISPKVTIEKNKAWGPIFQIQQLVFPEFGDYDVELYIDDKKVAATMFTLRDQAELTEN